MQQTGVLTLLVDSIRFLRYNFFAIALIVVPVQLFVLFSVMAYGALVSVESAPVAFALLRLLTDPIIEIAVIFLMASIVAGDELDTKTCWFLGLKFWWPFLLLDLSVGVMCLVGLVLFVLPGVVAMGRFALARFHLLFDEQGPVDAIQKSWNSTKSYWVTIVMGYLGIFVVLLPVWFIVGSSAGIFRLVLDTLVRVVEMLFAIFGFRVYSLAKESTTENK